MLMVLVLMLIFGFVIVVVSYVLVELFCWEVLCCWECCNEFILVGEF